VGSPRSLWEPSKAGISPPDDIYVTKCRPQGSIIPQGDSIRVVIDPGRAMKRHSPRRQIFLFVAAVILPCLVLVAAGVRMVSQEREVAEARVHQERVRVARQLGQDLLVHLSQLWTEIPSATDSPAPSARAPYPLGVVFVSEIRGGRLVLPWESRSPGVSPGEFPLVRLGERQELAMGDLEAAGNTFRRALDASTNQGDAGLARLYLARTLVKRNRFEEALPQYRALLALPTEITDDLGIPLSFYAAERLVVLKLRTEEVLPFLSRESRSPVWTTPAAIYLLHDVSRELLEALPAGSSRDSAAAAEALAQGRVREVEQILDLANQMGVLGLSSVESPGSPPDRWVLFGFDPWLVGRGRTLDGVPRLVSVDAQEALHAVSSSQQEELPGLTLAPDGDPDGLTLDPRLRGLRVRFTLSESESLSKAVSRQRTFYSIALLLVVGFTLFGGYLLWRDVQREVGMARLRSQFVSGVSHELKTPLTSIRMFAETLLQRRPEDWETQAEFLSTIVDESTRLSRLLGNVLEFSAIEGGKRQYQFVAGDLGEVLQAAVRTIQQRLDSEGFTLDTDVEEGLAPVPMDGDAIEQAVLNLLTNAMKYSGKSRRIDLAAKREGEEVSISVSDRGLGISATEQRRIFESFYRGGSPDVEEIPGTGLGLTLVQHIAEAHGGSVEVESTPGRGSTFTLRLPLERIEA
jgi:signal transduction histidine kinase